METSEFWLQLHCRQSNHALLLITVLQRPDSLAFVRGCDGLQGHRPIAATSSNSTLHLKLTGLRNLLVFAPSVSSVKDSEKMLCRCIFPVFCSELVMFGAVQFGVPSLGLISGFSSNVHLPL